jgi:hypothetical protein
MFQAGLLCHLGDNLESHGVAGFSTCFSSSDICRECHLAYNELPDIFGIPTSDKWTVSEYDKICDSIETEQDIESSHGVRERCIFNSLQAFHCIDGFPFDAMHDWLEKQATCDAQSVILSLAKKGLFTVEKYNSLLGCLRFQSYESSDRPLPIKSSSDKLCGKALSVCLHVRVMPLLVSQLVGEGYDDDDLIDLLLVIHRINEVIMSDVLTPGDILDFECLLVDFFEKRKLCADQFPGEFKKLTPRGHYLEHYPRQMARYGPMTCVWTARYEGKHREFIGFSDASKNFINIVKTISIKHQKRLASRCFTGLFSAPEIQFPTKTTSTPDPGLPSQFFEQGMVFVI